MALFMKMCDEETREHMEAKMKHKFGMCPVMLVLIIAQLFHLYKLRQFDHSLEKVMILKEVKDEEDKKQKILVAAQAYRN